MGAYAHTLGHILMPDLLQGISDINFGPSMWNRSSSVHPKPLPLFQVTLSLSNLGSLKPGSLHTERLSGLFIKESFRLVPCL